MRSQVALFAVLLLALPGCLERGPPQPADGQASATGSAATPPRPVGTPPEGFVECVELEVRAQPPTLDSGEAANVAATVRNLCDQKIQIQGADSCTHSGVEAWIEWNGTPYFLQRTGAAADSQNCTRDMPPPVDVAGEGEHVVSWAWNGTLYRSNAADSEREGSRSRPASTRSSRASSFPRACQRRATRSIS